MPQVYGVRRTHVSAQVSVASTGDKAVFTPGQPVDVVRWGFIADALVDVGVGLTIALDHRPTAASDTGRTAKDTLTTTVDVAAGKGLYTEPAKLPSNALPDSAGVNQGGTIVEVNPGEELVFEVTDAADTAGTCFMFVEYLEKPFAGSRISNMTEVANA